MALYMDRMVSLRQQELPVQIDEYIRKLRIEKAKRLFTQQPALSLADISFECGFHDAAEDLQAV